MTDFNMPRHVVVDGSNLATEGRPLPSLKQLNEAVMAYMAENPDALITVVVDATFGHRIDSKEVAEFDAAVSNNEIVAPPAGAIGRGDAFVLSIANKVNATILSNDSYQEFHGTHTWLFDEGRLVGGKPVPHIGWVFVNRLPVRGPTSRKSVSEAKRGRPSKIKAASPEASQPMPIPASPPPGATLQKSGRGRDSAKTAAAAKHADASKAESTKSDDQSSEPTPRSTGTNDLLAFLTFVEHHKPGSSVNAIVENYSSHGAYVRIGDVKGYVPLSLMSDPPPRSAREFMKIGESITLVVESFAPARRSIDLAIPTMTTVKMLPGEAPVEAKPKRVRKAATKALPVPASRTPTDIDATTTEIQVGDAASPKPKKRASKKAAAAAAPAAPVGAKPRSRQRAEADTPPAPPQLAPPVKKRTPRKTAAPTPTTPSNEPSPPAKPTRRRTKAA
ncbi:MAG: S1 RNA-binding domain-containing protein [Ilumatobacteraceae bacterium]